MYVQRYIFLGRKDYFYLKKMVTLQQINTLHDYYPFVERLLCSAFPPEERRDDEQQRINTNENDKFRCFLIRNYERPIGVLTAWYFTNFVYIEHFAIQADLRNNGYGKQALLDFLQQTQLPIVLEVEMPRVKGDITHRRIAFYRRMGFVLRKMAYKQPPYRIGDKWLPMKLMSNGNVKWERIAEEVRDTIYREVYSV